VNSVQGLAWAACGRAEIAGEPLASRVVPQNTQPAEPDSRTRFRTVFWRVPVWCPLPDTMVERVAAPKKQPLHLWETKSWSVPGERIQ